MLLPANAQQALVNLTTNAAPNTATVTALVASPGGSSRIRLWRVQAVHVQNAAAQVVRLYVKETTSGTYRGVTIFTVGAPGIIDLSGFGGLALATANGLSAETYCTLAAQTLPCFVYYTTELA